MSISIASDCPSVAYDGELTFAGLIQKYFVEFDSKHNNVGISRNWNEKTAAACRYDYDRRILPTLHSFCNKDTPAHVLTGEHFELVLQKLADDYNYSSGTIAHYRHLIMLAYQAGVEHDHFPDTLYWEDLFDSETASVEEKETWRVNVMTRLRKSFSRDEEQRIVQWFSELQPETATGEAIGLLLMFVLGLRNNEACGANFSSIRRLEYYPDTAVFDMLQSTKLNSSEVKSGGKTSNAPRTLLVMEPVYVFIQKRKDFLLRLIEERALALPKNVNTVEDLPLVCKKTSFCERASSRDLAAAGKKLFDKIGIDKSELSALFQILCSSEVQQLQIEDKEPTTYLFRRNCATHLYQLGFSPSEIQYWMGHEIEDPFIMRSFYSDPDQLYALKEKWERHPVLSLLNKQIPAGIGTLNKMLPIQEDSTERFELNLSVKGKTDVLVCVDTPEPKCELSLSVQCDASGLKTQYRLVPKKSDYSRSVLIEEKVRRVYQNRQK